MLPLKIAPAPAATARDFVGRVEALSPYMRQTIETALAVDDTATLAKCGRFLDAYLAMMRGVSMSPEVTSFLNQARMQAAKADGAQCKAEPITVPTNVPLQ